MNIFAIEGHKTDIDWVASARSQDNLRVVKMILESCQMLCTVLNQQHGHQITPYKSVHQKHPCTVWVARSSDNWIQLYNHCEALLDEYRLRFANAHKCAEVLEHCAYIFDALRFDEHGPTPIALCMPEEFKSDDVVDSYRRFYASKPNIRYPKNKIPEWFLTYRALPFTIC
jgi:hypothetical protein